MQYLPSWFALTDENKRAIFRKTAEEKGVPDFAVEKDWWLVHLLGAIFSLGFSDGTFLFKGGTSLSKGWKLIDRFSEDIDLVLDRGFLGFNENLNNSQINKLRKKSKEFVNGEFVFKLQNRLNELGLESVSVKASAAESSDQDPTILEVTYNSLTETNASGYLQPRLLLEVSCRSLRDPFKPVGIASFVSEIMDFVGKDFVDSPIQVPTVNPERTFLEKIFLLHEEFQKQAEKVRTARLSRHLYDIYKLEKRGYFEVAFEAQGLYNAIVQHRKRFNTIIGIDYERHFPPHVSFIPPGGALKEWEKDYSTMQENMIFGDSPAFDDLIMYLQNLQQRINRLKGIQVADY